MSPHARTTKGPPFVQPAGCWRERGAGPLSLRLGMGLDVAASHLDPLTPGNNGNSAGSTKNGGTRNGGARNGGARNGGRAARARNGDTVAAFAQDETDALGNTPWHYWADGPSPMDHFALLRESRWWQVRDLVSGRGEHPWHRLAIHGHAQALEAWAGHAVPGGKPGNAGATSEGDTLVHRAAWSGEERTVAFAIAHSPCECLSVRDASGLTPLMVAVHRCTSETIQALLDAGADPNIGDEQGRTALHHAAMYADSELIALLERAGGDIDTGDLHGLGAKDVLRAKRELTERDRESLRTHWARRAAAKAAF